MKSKLTKKSILLPFGAILIAVVLFFVLSISLTGSFYLWLTGEYDRVSQTFPQEVLYGELHDFELLENGVILAISGDPWIVLRTDPPIAGNLLSISISELSVSRTFAQIYFAHEPGRFYEQHSVGLTLRNGLNRVSIPDSSFVELRLDLTDTPRVSMIVEQVELSNYVILSLFFWLVYVSLLILCICMLYILLYHRVWFFHILRKAFDKIGVVLNFLLRKIERHNTAFKITVAALIFISLIVTGIAIFQAAQGFTPGADIAQLDEHHRNLIRLEIFRLCIIMFLIITVGVVFIVLSLNIKLEYVYIVIALSLGIVYMLVMTPLSIPDEPHHYHTAYALSGFMFLQDDPFVVDSRHFETHMLYGHKNVPTAYLRLMDEGIYILRGDIALIDLPTPYELIYPLQHIPQTIGVAIARLLNLSFFGVFFAGRFFNLLFYILCVFLSMKRLVGFKLPIFIIGLLPMTLHQAASFSSDAFINGISLLLIAYAIYFIYEKKTFRWRDFLTLLLFGLLLAPAKVVYSPITLLTVLAAIRWKECINNKAWLLSAIIVASAAAASFIIFFIAWDFGDAYGPAVIRDGERNFTLSFVLSYPLATFQIFMRTVGREALPWVYGAFGRYLSGLSIFLPLSYTLIIIGIFVASVFYGKRDEWSPTAFDRIVFLAISLIIILLVMASMFFGFTSDFNILILGIQGRYFVPLIPLTALLIRHNSVLIPERAFRNVVVVAAVLIQIFVIVFIIDYTIGYYLI